MIFYPEKFQPAVIWCYSQVFRIKKSVGPVVPKASNRSGFTLMEVLVAISVLAICLVVILQLFSGGLKNSKLSDDYTRGIFHAREKMEEIILTDILEEGSAEGEFEDGFRWKADIVRMEQKEEEALRLPFDTFTITVEMSWGPEGHEKHFEIDTLKVAEKIKSGDEASGA